MDRSTACHLCRSAGPRNRSGIYILPIPIPPSPTSIGMRKCDHCQNTFCPECIRGQGWTDQGKGGTLSEVCYNCSPSKEYHQRLLDKIKFLELKLESANNLVDQMRQAALDLTDPNF